jgi:glycogen(starch) synthase
VHYADAVSATSPGHARALAERYRIPMPTVVRNLPEQIAPAGQREARGERTLAYVGGLMPGRGLEQAIDALALLHGVRLRAIGPGARGYRQGLIDRAARLGVADRLELCDPVLPAELVGELAGADVGLCLIQPVCRSYALALPNKLFEYVAAGLPVLCSDLPVMADVVREARLGEVVDHRDPAAIAVGALKLLDGGPDIAPGTATFAGANRWRDEASILERLYGTVTGEERA